MSGASQAFIFFVKLSSLGLTFSLEKDSYEAFHIYYIRRDESSDGAYFSSGLFKKGSVPEWSSGPGFESRSDHYLDLFLGSPELKSSATLVNSQLVCLRPVGILKNVMFKLNYLFQLFARPH